MPNELQHYVPQFLLRNFADAKMSRTYVYDKLNSRRFRANVKKVAAEKGYYDVSEGQEPSASFEEALASVERSAAPVVKRLLKADSICSLSTEEVVTFALFLATQFTRTKEAELRIDDLMSKTSEKLRAMGVDEGEISRLMYGCENDWSSRLFRLSHVGSAVDYVPYFLHKRWVLYRTSRSDPFYISDNPVTLHNSNDYGPYGNLGLAVPGIEIYLPLHPTLCLGLICPTTVKQFEGGYQALKRIGAEGERTIKAKLQHPEYTKSFLKGMFEGTPIDLKSESVMMINSLQVTFSSRFVFSHTDSFGLVERMLADNARYRTGHRLSMD